MKTKLLAGLLVLLGVAVAVILWVRPGGKPVGGEGGGTGSAAVGGGSGGRLGADSDSEPKVLRPHAGSGAGSSAAGGGGEPDVGASATADLGEPHEPPHAAKLAADALVRQRDLVKTELAGLKERAPKLKAVLEKLRGSSEATPLAIQQIQTQLQQTVDALARLERELPDLERKVAGLPKPAPEKPPAP